jgi:tetratricopeptide (TPR) repeat protein
MKAFMVAMVCGFCLLSGAFPVRAEETDGAAELDSAAVAAEPEANGEAGAAQAAKALVNAREREPVRPWAYKRLERAFAALSAAHYDEVLEALDEMKPNPKLNHRESALMWQTYGYAYTNKEQYPEAADAFARCLAEDALPTAAALHTRYNLAQLLVMLERPEEAIAEFDQWFAEARNPSPTAYYMAAMAHMQKGDIDTALEYAGQALENSTKAKESWLQLVVALHLKKEDYAGAEPALLQLIELYPKKSYWMQLAAVYSETERHEKALTTLELVHTQGMLDQSSEYTALAQMYLYNQIPFEAARVLEEGLEKKILPRDVKTLQLLGDSWLHARERERALPPMREAAEMAPDGNGYLRVAQILVEREEWGEARAALSAAIDKGELHHPGHAQLLLGIANVNAKHWGEAEQAFQAAAADVQTEKAAEFWLQHLASRRPMEPADEQPAVAANDTAPAGERGGDNEHAAAAEPSRGERATAAPARSGAASAG